MAMQMRRMEALRRHRGLWSQFSGGNMVGERRGEVIGGAVSRYVSVGVMFRVRESKGQVGWAWCKIVLVRVVALELR